MPRCLDGVWGQLWPDHDGRFISPLLSRECVGGAAGRTQGEDAGLEEGGGTATSEGTGAGLVIQETRLFPQSALVGTI